MKQLKDIRSFRGDLRRLTRELVGELKTSVKCCGVTLVQCHTLLAVADAQPATVGDLAAELGLDKSTSSRTIDTLVRLGLVQRAAAPGDRRQASLSLTPSGQAEVQRIDEFSDRYYREILAPLPASEQDVVYQGMACLVRALAKARKPAGRARKRRCRG
jgi:DNA-binding MarR family transcriptional regulator